MQVRSQRRAGATQTAPHTDTGLSQIKGPRVTSWNKFICERGTGRTHAHQCFPELSSQKKITLIICKRQSWTADKGICQAPGAYQNFLSFFLGRGGRRPSPVGGRPELARQRPGPPERWKEKWTEKKERASDCVQKRLLFSREPGSEARVA